MARSDIFFYWHDSDICACRECRGYKPIMQRSGICGPDTRLSKYRRSLYPAVDPEPVESMTSYITGLIPNPLRMLTPSARRVMDWAIGNRSPPVVSTPKGSTVITSQMPALEVFNCLVKEHGCVDMSPELTSWSNNPSTPCAGGTFGDVYRGTKNDGSVISIKCLRLHTSSGSKPKDAKRAGREFYNCFKAKHRNVLELYGVALIKGQIAMISPWMENGNLRQYLETRPEVNRWALCIQVAEGLAYIHEIGMVHGDMKAENILVSSDGIVKIGDFGNSILEECSLRCTATTRVGGGTFRWMTWELVYQPDPPADRDAVADTESELVVDRSTRTDVYALGMTILEVVSGRRPHHERRTDAAVISALIRHILPTRPEQLSEQKEWGNERWELLVNCWDVDPMARPTSQAVLDRMVQIQ
ncbi:tyrosine kinase domain protein [Rhizoctonia solani AG-3 Rhs1AP]|uniref:Tyrosine kinase domain protein n=2 Tax=Rhizoctonia solani AG-3 TaxID=1086053 RepID=A0A074S1L3_9AGAM|nr:tyrosine kinase domain protein [Rhizoctonia solani AG-3 Rhs1AP]KEP53139.1 tyrosine kinase domain protein [Rhizoctonia solani 123E]